MVTGQQMLTRLCWNRIIIYHSGL